ncbi:MAG: Arylsulfatase [Planctomycetes bacterium ADurb.Bin126]|nr:MAG: Arylsulfatase [Planctomycetes bacterium ADurb.Bin126]HOD83263.1 sulfatase [Phycisphaerae bacterium]HQL71821.1 sulfatase [Phycisphaerae bacterium]
MANQMDRREMMARTMGAVMAGLGLTGSLASGQGKGADGKKRPNILWLIGEDFGCHLGCYGTKEVWSPNLDKLAAEGVRYNRFYTTAPVCSPSRSAFMTGMYQTTIGVHNHRSHRDDGYALPDGVCVFTDILRRDGYYTANVREFPKEVGFRGTGKTDWNFTYQGKPFDTASWTDLKDHQPFYAQVNFSETHRTFRAPPKADPAKVDLPPYYPDHPVARKDWAAYLDSASELDRKIGLVLKQLEADGLADDTIVVFFGDNGEAHVRGKQFCYETGLHVPMIIRWAKNFPVPEHFKPGSADDRLLMSIDLSATTLDVAGSKLPDKMEGRPFLGPRAVDRQYVYGARDRCDETVFRIRTACDKRYRYIRNFLNDRPLLQPNKYKERQYPVWNLLKELNAQGKLKPEQAALCAPSRAAEELYDLQADPHETRNLASDPAHADTLKRMRKALEEWIEQTNDQGRALESEDVARNEGRTRAAKPKADKKNKKKKE